MKLLSNNRTNYLAGACLLSLLLWFMVNSAIQSHLALQAQALSDGQEKVGPGITQLLQVEGSAYIVVALVTPAAMNRVPLVLDEIKDEINAQQTAVLAAVNEDDFNLSHQFQAVPALAGTINSRRGLDELAAHPYVAKIDLDVGGTGHLAQSVPLIGADGWQQGGNLGAGVVVAVLDSGIDADHPDLAASLIYEACFLDNDGSINGIGLCPNGSDRQFGPGAAADGAGHGTHVSGIVAARGMQHAPGVAPGADIVSVKVLDNSSFSGSFYSFLEIVAALDFIIDERPDVQLINMSLGTNALFAGDCDASTSWNMAGAAAINTLRSLGVTSFASSGNNGSGTHMSSPACLSNVIAVGATNNNDEVASFTNSNAATDIMAPGVGTVAAAIGGGTVAASGTSMASPHVAGCAALLLAAHTATTPDEIETWLKSSSVVVTDTTNNLAFPRLDCTPVWQPPTALTITGPISGFVGHEYTFTAAVSPLTTTQPITYTWQVTGQEPLTGSSGLSHTVSLVWDIPGFKTIQVTAVNIEFEITATYGLLIHDRIYLPLILSPLPGTD
jgi:hypothetical protein